VEQSELVKFVVEKLEDLDVPYAIVGSLASCIWGEPRLTPVIDIVLDARPFHSERIAAAFSEVEFVKSSTDIHDEISSSGQFHLIHPASGIRIVFMTAGRTAWAAAQLSRRKRVPLFADLSASVAAPEDVILGKLVYYRDGGSELHLRDVASILKVSDAMIDRNYVERFARRFGVVDIWEAILARVYHQEAR
jgi:hypothetical protein